MLCPDCNGPTRVLSTRFSHETSQTRRRKCTICGAIHFTAEVRINRQDVELRKHYHISQPALVKLLQATYS